MESQYREEVFDLHRFIERWLKGTIDKSEQAFARLKRALAHDFVVVQPSGIKEDKEKVLQNFFGAYATRPGPFEIEIRDFDMRQVTDALGVVTYEEWHFGRDSKGRIATAVLRRRHDQDGVEWVHLHETAFTSARTI